MVCGEISLASRVLFSPKQAQLVNYLLPSSRQMARIGLSAPHDASNAVVPWLLVAGCWLLYPKFTLHVEPENRSEKNTNALQKHSACNEKGNNEVTSNGTATCRGARECNID